MTLPGSGTNFSDITGNPRLRIFISLCVNDVGWSRISEILSFVKQKIPVLNGRRISELYKQQN